MSEPIYVCRHCGRYRGTRLRKNSRCECGRWAMDKVEAAAVIGCMAPIYDDRCCDFGGENPGDTLEEAISLGWTEIRLADEANEWDAFVGLCPVCSAVEAAPPKPAQAELFA